jgi:hypothetical protein
MNVMTVNCRDREEEEHLPEEKSLEIKDSELVFNNVWNKLEKKYGPENLRFPKEIIWLMGAPGTLFLNLTNPSKLLFSEQQCH